MQLKTTATVEVQSSKKWSGLRIEPRHRLRLLYTVHSAKTPLLWF